jgi:SAM-dependent methyltransferase
VEAAARALGAYYTPDDLADPVCRWALRSPADTVFDPSCGEGAFLARGVSRLLELGTEPRRLADQIAGVELNARALAHARGALLSRHPGLRWGRLAQDDFFAFTQENLGSLQFDAVVGNPPFLRTQGRSVAAKQRALRVAHACGAPLTADASAWAPFVAAASAFVRPGGRLAMIVPREALFVNYTRPLLEHLARRFARVDLVALDDYWFEDALVKVAVLLAEGEGPGSVRIREARRLDDLDQAADAEPLPSWVWSRIPENCRAAASAALESPDLAPLTDLADLSIGVVTGEKDYFLLPRARARELGLPGDYLLPALSKPSQLAGTAFTKTDAAELAASGEPCRLLAIPPSYAGGLMSLDAYLAEGIERGIDRNYKCRTRKPWYSVRRLLEPPDAFLGYLVKWRPRFAANEARAHCTNNLHRLWFREPGAAPLASASALNAATMLSIELLGRIAAAGALKIEPGDAPRIRMIPPGRLRRSKGAADAIDRALREGRATDAYAAADAWACEALGWDPREMARLRRAQRELCDARLRA